jgi:DNA-binding NarL/FixJ family response regulator
VTPQEQQPSPDVYRQLIEREVQLRKVMHEMQQLLDHQENDTSPDSPRPVAAPLTPRELEILRLVAEGATNQEIGRKLHLSTGTVRNYNSAIFRKLGVGGRTQAAVRAIELGIVSRAEVQGSPSATVNSSGSERRGD